MSRPHRKTWIQLQVKLDMTNRLQVRIALAPYTHTLYLLSRGERRSQNLNGHQPPPSFKLSTTDLCRLSLLVPDDVELWDSGGATPNPGPLPSTPVNPLHWVQHPARPCFETTKEAENKLCFFSPTSIPISGFGRILFFENICTSLYQKHTAASRGLIKCCNET